ncbi:MAG: MBL fold metallo-hydrolase [Lachnospiraceae bacterium]|nr:MBL fold metallo-hydrolase [Lachnospiraceae bacterium]
MKITWIGHSCFKIEKDGFSIIIDPYADGSVPGYLPVRETVDMVLCTHEHSDHNFREGVTLTGRTKLPFKVETIDTYHDDEGGTKRGTNKIFMIDDGETQVAHFGDLGCVLTPEQLLRLRYMDAVFIPVGGFFTINARQAADLVHFIKPRIVIPMHYHSTSKGFGYDVLGTVAEFTNIMDSVKTVDGSELETVSDPGAQVVVLRPRNVG